MTTTDVPVADLAREHNTTTARVLEVADTIIGRVVRDCGADAARGLTTRPGPGGTVRLTAPLADLVREHFA